MLKQISQILDNAREKVADNDIEGAIFHYKKVVEMDPENEQAHFELGSLYHQIGDLSSALSSFCCVVDINPENKKAKVNMDMLNSILNYYHKDRLNP